MNNYYNQPYDRDPRLTVSSVLLLAIFVSAFVFIVAAALWQPWDGSDNATVLTPASTTADEPLGPEAPAADGLEVVVQPATQ